MSMDGEDGIHTISQGYKMGNDPIRGCRERMIEVSLTVQPCKSIPRRDWLRRGKTANAKTRTES